MAQKKKDSPKQILKQWNDIPSSRRTGRLAKQHAYRCGMKSMAEVEFAVFLQDCRKRAKYEPDRLPYTLYYIPDFKVKDVYFEVKGKMTPDMWTKMKAVKLTNPEKRIIIVFVRGKNKIRAGSKTTYVEKAEKLGYEVFSVENEESMEALKELVKGL